MQWLIYPAVLLVIVAVLAVIMVRRSKAAAAIDPSERSNEGEPLGARETSLGQSTTVLPERPTGPGTHY